MSITTISSREFNQNVTAAKSKALSGPVFITDRGNVAHVLLSIEEYQSITGQTDSIIESLAMPESEDIDFDPPKASDTLYKPEDLT